MNYRCVEIPEPDFDASFTDEMVVTAYQDEDDFNPQMPDEYPNVRLSQLEFNIQQTALTAAEAFEAAEDAEQIADQAAQAAQEAAGIAEGAATTAGEATQTINEHAGATNNPHATNVTQEFADTQITPLSVEATYTPTVWSYLVGLFTTVPKSVKEHIVKIWERLGLLEDQYILKYVVPVDTTAINLTTDRYGNAFNFKEGTILEIDFKIEAFVGNVASRIYLKVNDTFLNLYWNTATLTSSNIPLSGGIYYGELTRCNFTFYNGEIQGHTDSGVKPTSGGIFSISQRYIFHTLNLNATSINSIKLFGNAIPSGTVVLIKKI